MFYSETLLSKTGPLARVWLSANIERKLSKNHVLQTNVKDSVEAIVTPNQAPLALRLSGQLLLGVARIYRRKANYLLDDCNEALLKIKMAFRTSGNNDMAEGLNMPSRDALMLPDVLTEGDDLEMPPLPDATFFLSQIDEDSNLRKKRAGSREINLQEDFSASQFISTSTENDDEILEPIDELDLGLDLGFDLDTTSKIDATNDISNDISLQVGRDAPAPRDFEDEIMSKIDTPVPSKDLFEMGDGDTSLNVFQNDGVRMADDDIEMADNDEDVDMFADEPQDISLHAIPPVYPERISESPLSDIDEVLAAEVEAEQRQKRSPTIEQQADEEEEQDSEIPVTRRPALRARRQRQLHPDSVTELSSAQIKNLQSNTERILRPRLFLPRDSGLFALSQMQKSGAFASQVIAGKRGENWAPELRGILSLDTVRNLKRKRDSDLPGISSTNEPVPMPSPRLELGDDEDLIMADAPNNEVPGLEIVDAPVMDEPSFMDVGADDTLDIRDSFEENEAHPENREIHSVAGDSPHATVPHGDASEEAATSFGSEHAVHVLRNHFDSLGPRSPESYQNNSVLFEELRPEAAVSRADATKFFFEILVLGTKDAITVEQEETTLGGPIRIRAKPDLWGAWAEREAVGDSEPQDAPPDGPALVAAA